MYKYFVSAPTRDLYQRTISRSEPFKVMLSLDIYETYLEDTFTYIGL